MPSINLRLTEEEHAALKEWAYEGRRSMQQEVVFRIFAEMQDSGRAVQGPGESSDPSQSRQAHGSESVRFGAGSPGTDLNVTPDFKKGKK